MNSDDRIFVAGHRGLVGAAIVRRLHELNFTNLLLRTHAELDLCNQAAVGEFFAREKPAYVFLAAAKVGGILANSTYPAQFIRDNLLIQCNVIDAARSHGVSKLCFLGSSCIYPRLAPQPLREEYLLTGPLEATNEWYAIAKLAGIKMCQAYARQYGLRAISLLPTNLYGPGDNFSLAGSHVLPALIRRCDEARSRGDAELTVWGTGTPRREFLHVDDLADACVFLMHKYESDEPINVGAGTDLTIAELARTVAAAVGFTGRLVFDPSKPDGTPRKLLDTSKINALGWSATIPLEAGIARTYDWYRENQASLRG
jgi:GDP-L-fucose synthase